MANNNTHTETNSQVPIVDDASKIMTPVYVAAYYGLCETFFRLNVGYQNCQAYINSMLYAFDKLSKRKVHVVDGYCLYPVSSMVIGARNLMVSNYYGKISFVYDGRYLMKPDDYRAIDKIVKTGDIPHGGIIADICSSLTKAEIDKFVAVYMDDLPSISNRNVSKVLGYNVLRDILGELVSFVDTSYANSEGVIRELVSLYRNYHEICCKESGEN